jgi:hypothetical protein
MLYFGTTAATLNPADAIEFRGDTTARIGLTAAVLRDITGDGRDEIAIASPSMTVGGVTNRGRVFIYRGRDRADWLTLVVGGFITVGTNADFIIDGPNPLLSTGNSFGQNRRGLVSTTDFDGDTFPDIAIPTSRSTINRYRVYGSATVKTSTGAMPLDGTASYRLELTETVGTDVSTTSGLGTASLANADFFGSSGFDLLVSNPGAGQILMYSALTAPTTPTVNPPTTQRLFGPQTYGQAFSMADVDGDGFQDFVSGTVLTANNNAYLLYQNSGAFETGGIAGPGQFRFTRFDATAITGNSASRLGGMSLLANVAGDSNVDVILGDSVVGAVRIWR